MRLNERLEDLLVLRGYNQLLKRLVVPLDQLQKRPGAEVQVPAQNSQSSQMVPLSNLSEIYQEGQIT